MEASLISGVELFIFYLVISYIFLSRYVHSQKLRMIVILIIYCFKQTKKMYKIIKCLSKTEMLLFIISMKTMPAHLGLDNPIQIQLLYNNWTHWFTTILCVA